MWAHVGSKMIKKAIFIPATPLPTQFSLEEKFLRAKSSSTLSKLTNKLAGLHKILQKFIFTETNH